MNTNNIFQLIQMLQSGNPEQLALNLLAQRSGNPMIQNLIDLAGKGDTAAIEQIVRNIAKERGIDYDKEFNSFRRAIKL